MENETGKVNSSGERGSVGQVNDGLPSRDRSRPTSVVLCPTSCRTGAVTRSLRSFIPATASQTGSLQACYVGSAVPNLIAKPNTARNHTSP
ncbi:hypothetical protein TWF569_000125 [Orbilia oligospora]|nr:hypothetical protein TWF103_005255 [Orbilia oligospora]KAF3157559.1 hypothetical protein TWF569_000125 [Orbilia oligospora]